MGLAMKLQEFQKQAGETMKAKLWKNDMLILGIMNNLYKFYFGPIHKEYINKLI